MIAIDDILIEKKRKNWLYVGLIRYHSSINSCMIFCFATGYTLFGDKVDNEDKVSTITRGALTSGDRKDRKWKNEDEHEMTHKRVKYETLLLRASFEYHLPDVSRRECFRIIKIKKHFYVGDENI